MVDRFEEALCEFTGAPYAVTVDSCTNAIFLALSYQSQDWYHERVIIPSHTYVGVVHAVKNAGWAYQFADVKWKNAYRLHPTNIWDCAKEFYRGMYRPGDYMCVSFQAGKLLPIGRGGAILTDNARADDWFRKARLDGREAGADYQKNRFQGEGYHMYMTPPDAARGLWLMTYLEDDDKADWTEYPDLSEATWE